jgi:hypothetical protein
MAFGDGGLASVPPRGLAWTGLLLPGGGEDVPTCTPMSPAMLPTVRTSHARGCGGPANAAASSRTSAAADTVRARPRIWRPRPEVTGVAAVA